MRYLGLALFAEGPTDHRFLRPVLHRLVDDLCVHLGRDIVEVGEILELHSPRRAKEENRATRVLEAARDAWGEFDVLFVHTDGGGDPQAAEEERVQPARDRIVAELGDEVRVLPVLPVRETEAWAAADGDALRAAFGSVLDDEALSLPARRHEVENINDPKQLLDQAYTRVVGKKRHAKGVAHLLGVIGERVRLSCLRDVPAFSQFETRLRGALAELGYIKKAKR